ncbi:MAG: hypothetical protein JNK27_11045 [Chitinophagaceae bacterium]|nr:hypothetical protein [Chitinophagaceae bacterium]
MTNTNSFVQPDVLEKNMLTIHSFLKQSYDEAKKQLENGVTLLQEGATFFKEEFSTLFQETGQYFNRMLLPVNNFIKDLQQIDTELLREVSMQSPHHLLIDGEMMPVEKILEQPMEEN